jgi:dihydroxyacid dehydratase/phosphogluconate dehydratase
MNTTQPNFDKREARSKAVARAVMRLSERLQYQPEVVFEGAIRGAAALLIANGSSPEEVAELLANAGEQVRAIDLSDLVRSVN